MQKQEIQTLLNQGVVRIVFQKKDGSTRVMLCTTQPGVMPPPPARAEGPDGKPAPGRPIPENHLLVWDIEAQGLRSFDIGSLLEDPRPVAPPGNIGV